MLQDYSWQEIRKITSSWSGKAAPGLVVIALVMIARLSGSLQFIEWMAFDLFLRLRPAEPKDERIVIIGINDTDIQDINQYPIPDQEIAELLNILQGYKPRVIGLHIIRDIPFEPGHQKLLTTWQNLENLIVIEKALPEVIAAPPEFTAEKVGFTDLILDQDTNLRRILLGTFTEKKEEYKFAFSLRLAEAYLDTEVENGIRDSEAMRFGETEIPRLRPNSGGYVRTDANGVQMLLNFRSGEEPFTLLSLSDIKKGNFESSLLEDKLVII
ncbi:MAG: CHASE2 domain-containing protein, partial [Okeania sp. SIO2D1]|nr:CHASE2 domain-containing protein [Okeania sp. SIO2D1]